VVKTLCEGNPFPLHLLVLSDPENNFIQVMRSAGLPLSYCPDQDIPPEGYQPNWYLLHWDDANGGVRAQFRKGVCNVLYQLLKKGFCHTDLRPANICVTLDDPPVFTVVDWDMVCTDTKMLPSAEGDSRYPAGKNYYRTRTAAQILLCVFYIRAYLESLPESRVLIRDCDFAVKKDANWWIKDPPSNFNPELKALFHKFLSNANDGVKAVGQACCSDPGMCDMEALLKGDGYWNQFVEDLLQSRISQ
jgi:hypothetical protein